MMTPAQQNQQQRGAVGNPGAAPSAPPPGAGVADPRAVHGGGANGPLNGEHARFIAQKLMAKGLDESKAKDLVSKMKARCFSAGGFDAGTTLRQISVRSVEQAEKIALHNFQMQKAQLLQEKQAAQQQQRGGGAPGPLHVGQQILVSGAITTGSSSSSSRPPINLNLQRVGTTATSTSHMNQPMMAGRPTSTSTAANNLRAAAGGTTSAGGPARQPLSRQAAAAAAEQVNFLAKNSIFGGVLQEAAKKAHQLPWMNQYEKAERSNSSANNTQGGRGNNGANGRRAGSGEPKQRKQRVTKEEQAWQETLQQSAKAEEMAGGLVLTAPFVPIDPMPDRCMFRSDKWPPGHPPKFLTKNERHRLYDIWDRFGRLVEEEIEPELNEINERLAKFSRQCASSDELNSLRASLLKEKKNYEAMWVEAVQNAKLGTDIPPDDSWKEHPETIVAAQLLGFRVWQSMVTVGERKYFGAPTLEQGEARRDYWVLQKMLAMQESNYKLYLEQNKEKFDPDQYEKYLANATELTSTTIKTRTRPENKNGPTQGSFQSSTEDDDDNDGASKSAVPKKNSRGPAGGGSSSVKKPSPKAKNKLLAKKGKAAKKAATKKKGKKKGR